MPQPAKTAPSRLPLAIGSLWLLATLAVLIEGFRWALYISPTDAEQGNIGRVLYYHVPHSIWALVFPYVNLIASIAYLYLRKSRPTQALIADAWALASAEVTVVYATICLVTGSLWGRAAWGIWWAWDARMTSMLLLWLLYVAYLMVRRLSSTGQTSTVAAVLSVFAAIDVPIVYMSIRWWRTQHPQPVFFGAPDSGLDPSMRPAFYWNLLGFFMWGVFILTLRYALERRRQLAEASAVQSALNIALGPDQELIPKTPRRPLDKETPHAAF
jgi:heme exporter protein C